MTHGGSTSSTVCVTCSVPQNSVLGPLWFILYTADLADLSSTFGVNLYAFADDNQLYLHCSINDVISVASVLEQCIVAIGDWMIANRLKLNADKTEVIWMGSKHSTRILEGCSPSLTLLPPPVQSGCLASLQRLTCCSRNTQPPSVPSVFLTTPATENTSVTGHCIHNYTSPRFCHKSC